MMKNTFLTLLMIPFLCLPLLAQNSQNVSLFGQFHRGDIRYSGSWTYTNFNSRTEYALLGTRTGTAIYAIDNQPVQELAFIAGPASNWREITVLGSYAYVVTEGSGVGEGMQIIDLSNLPTTATLVNTYSATFTTGHIIQRDIYSDDPYVYIMGACNNCGVNILEVSDPENPSEIGNYAPGYYIHDAHIRGDYMYAAAFFEGVIDIVDISDKSKPTLVKQIEYTGGNTHSAWTSEDHKYLIISGEKDGLPARIWNIEDLDNLYEVATYSANLESLTHNPYVRGNYAFFSHNTEGLRVVDIKDPALPVEVGFYDTFDGPSGGFNGLWSACPYLPSGKIIGGNREDGLYVWTFNNARAGRFYATVKDAKTLEKMLPDSFYIHKKDVFLEPNLQGYYKFGDLPGNFRLEIKAGGYTTKLLDVRLEPGDSVAFDILLEPTSVGVFDFDKNIRELKVAPHPFQTFTVIDLAGFENANQVQIFNAYGQLVRTEKVLGNTTFLLERGNLQNGVYLFALLDDNHQLLANKKVVLTN
jgi:choice-of-anchor B domain-containing protein